MVRIDFEAAAEPEPKGYSWGLMHLDRVKAEAAHLRCPASLGMTRDIDEQCDLTIAELHRIAAVSTPGRKKRNGRAAPWWNRKGSEARKRAKRTERGWKATRTQRAWDFRAALNGYQKAIKEAERDSWRKTLWDASGDSRRTLSLARWERKHRHLPPEQPKMPLLRPEHALEPTAVTHVEKAAV